MFDYGRYKKDFPKGVQVSGEQLHTHLDGVLGWVKAYDEAYFSALEELDIWKEKFHQRKNAEEKSLYEWRQFHELVGRYMNELYYYYGGYLFYSGKTIEELDLIEIAPYEELAVIPEFKGLLKMGEQVAASTRKHSRYTQPLLEKWQEHYVRCNAACAKAFLFVGYCDVLGAKEAILRKGAVIAALETGAE